MLSDNAVATLEKYAKTLMRLTANPECVERVRLAQWGLGKSLPSTFESGQYSRANTFPLFYFVFWYWELNYVMQFNNVICNCVTTWFGSSVCHSPKLCLQKIFSDSVTWIEVTDLWWQILVWCLDSFSSNVWNYLTCSCNSARL